jgi:hypothetical protein
MANTYKAIATVTVGSGGAANIEFTSIPGTYTDLLVKLSARTSDNDSLHYGLVYVTVNNNTSGIYDNRRLFGYGTTTGSASNTDSTSWATTAAGSSATASTFGNAEFYFPNYTSSNNKSLSLDTVVETNDATNNLLVLFAGLAETTSAITSIKFGATSGQTLAQYSTATLYGIKNS